MNYDIVAVVVAALTVAMLVSVFAMIIASAAQS